LDMAGLLPVGDLDDRLWLWLLWTQLN